MGTLLLLAGYFLEAQAACKSGLWRVPLCGPIVLVNPRTRAVATSEPAPGPLPEKQPAANTAFDWNGRRWSMILWPLPENREQRAAVMMHELWHRIQADLGLPSTGPSNAHLDTLEGRYWLQLELRALAAALRASGDARREAAADAVAYRRHRRSLFPNAAAEERALEMHEGLAEYTGYALSGAPQQLALAKLAAAETGSSFPRSFAYATGPAWGLLLDESGRDWRARLTPQDDLAGLLGVAPAAMLAEERYGGSALRAKEIAREESRQRRLAEYRKLFVEGPVVEIPLVQMRMAFDPGEPAPLDTLGTVYPSIRITDVWGALEVTSGALLAADFRKVTVSAPARKTGWTLRLNEGWTLGPGKRQGDLLVGRSR